MKRLFLMIAAAACVALPLGDLALAQGRGEGRGPPRAERPMGPSDRGPAARGERRRFEDRRGPSRGYERREGGRRFEDRRGAQTGRWDDYDHGPRGEGRRRYEDRPSRSFAPPNARRGGYLPDRFRGGVVEDHRRYRLRPPPHGYAWVRVADGFALVSESSGQVFDIIRD